MGHTGPVQRAQGRSSLGAATPTGDDQQVTRAQDGVGLRTGVGRPCRRMVKTRPAQAKVTAPEPPAVPAQPARDRSAGARGDRTTLDQRGSARRRAPPGRSGGLPADGDRGGTPPRRRRGGPRHRRRRRHTHPRATAGTPAAARPASRLRAQRLPMGLRRRSPRRRRPAGVQRPDRPPSRAGIPSTILAIALILAIAGGGWLIWTAANPTGQAPDDGSGGDPPVLRRARRPHRQARRSRPHRR